MKPFSHGLRSALWVLFLSSLLLLVERHSLPTLCYEQEAQIYANRCGDPLEKLFVREALAAHQSIFLIIYSFNDLPLIAALNKQATRGVPVQIIHDPSTPQEGFEKLNPMIMRSTPQVRGLLHQKILLIDEEKLWLGSANMTRESLKMHDNLVIGIFSKELAEAVKRRESTALLVAGQWVEYWCFPEAGSRGEERLIQLIQEAQESIRLALFTWTHPGLLQAILAAHARGIAVEVVLDRTQAQSVGQKIISGLKEAGIAVHLPTGVGLLHHKFAWIDEEILINGSANWTHAAFYKNHDCLLILHSLTARQNKKLRQLWQRTCRKSTISMP